MVSKTQSAPGVVKSLNSRSGLAVVHLRVTSQGILSSLTDGLSDLFAREQVTVEMIQAREHGISFAVRNWPGLPSVLRQVDQSVRIEVQEDSAAIWLVGEGIAEREDTLTRTKAALGATEIRITSQGSSSLSLGFAVPEADLHAALETLHREFFAPSEAASARGVLSHMIVDMQGGARFQRAAANFSAPCRID